MTALASLHLLIFTQLCITSYLQASPVLLWTNANLPQSAVPFSSLSSLNLISDYICPLTEKQVEVRLLAVNDLTIEDIQRGPHCEHPLLLDARKTNSKFRFYPNVGDDAFERFSSIPRTNHAKCAHINFDLTSSKIHDNLNDTLNTLQTTIDTIGEDEDSAVVVALISGPVGETKLLRQRRQVVAANDTVLISNNNTCMFFAEKLRWNNVTGAPVGTQNYTLVYGSSSCTPTASSNGSDQAVVLNLLWRNEQQPLDTIRLELSIAIVAGYWHLMNTTLQGQTFLYMLYGMPDVMETPPTFSYVCTTAVFIQYSPYVTVYGQFNYSNQFFIDGLQFQPFNVQNQTFGQPNYCTCFFTRGIWMGITSSLICLLILFCGIGRILAIKTNDRFDDPKGKPLVIKAEE